MARNELRAIREAIEVEREACDHPTKMFVPYQRETNVEAHVECADCMAVVATEREAFDMWEAGETVPHYDA